MPQISHKNFIKMLEDLPLSETSRYRDMMLQIMKIETEKDAERNPQSFKEIAIRKHVDPDENTIFITINTSNSPTLSKELADSYKFSRTLTFLIKKSDGTCKPFGFYPAMESGFNLNYVKEEHASISIKVDGYNVRIIPKDRKTYCVFLKYILIDRTFKHSYDLFKMLDAMITPELIAHMFENNFCISFEVIDNSHMHKSMYQTIKQCMLVTCVSIPSTNVDAANQFLDYMEYERMKKFCDEFNLVCCETFLTPIPLLKDIMENMHEMRISLFYQLLEKYHIEHTMWHLENVNSACMEGFIVIVGDTRYKLKTIIECFTNAIGLWRSKGRSMEEKNETILKMFRSNSYTDDDKWLKAFEEYKKSVKTFPFRRDEFLRKHHII